MSDNLRHMKTPGQIKKGLADRRRAGWAAAALFAAAAACGATNEAERIVRVGADVRLRYDVTQGLPNAKRGEDPHSDYARIRLRPWIDVGPEGWGLYARLADEFRYYRRPVSKNRKQRFPDVVYIDNLYWRQKDLFGFLDLRVGRQDMAFGAKRIISDGTGGDGSRSAYFDAVRLTAHFDDARTLDAFALFNAHDDWLPTLGDEHENGKKPHPYDLNGYGQDELGAGLYYQDRSNASLGWDVYYVAKQELRGHTAKYRAEGRRAQTHTVGFRLLPKFTETLSGELEGAVQAGENSLFAGQGYAGLTYRPKLGAKPYLTGAVWGLTGDEDGARGAHAWHAVFNRETGLGESTAPMFEKYNYTNLLYPHLAAGCKTGDAASIKLQAGPLFAPVSEQTGSGDDAGHFRGAYAQVRCEIALGKLTGSDWMRGGVLSFQGEYLGKGDYFAEGDRNPALFGRVQLAWKF